MSAYIRAKQWGKPKSFYKNYWGKPRMKRKVYTRVAKKARKLMGWKKGGRRTKRRRRRRSRKRRGGVKHKGTIVHWNPGRGNGVIRFDHDETRSIGFHFTSAGLGSYEPSVGDKVEFNVNDSRIPRRAKDVVKLQEPEPMEIDFDQGAQEACKKNQKEKCITYLKELGLSQENAELVAAPFLSGKTHLAELAQKLQALVREHIGEGGGGGNQGGGGRKRRKRRRRRGGMNPQGNSGAPNLQEMEGDNQNENTTEIHNVENASGNAMQKQAGKAGVLVEGGNAATLSREPPKKKTLAEWKEIYRKRSHSWP